LAIEILKESEGSSAAQKRRRKDERCRQKTRLGGAFGRSKKHGNKTLQSSLMPTQVVTHPEGEKPGTTVGVGGEVSTYNLDSKPSGHVRIRKKKRKV